MEEESLGSTPTSPASARPCKLVLRRASLQGFFASALRFFHRRLLARRLRPAQPGAALRLHLVTAVSQQRASSGGALQFLGLFFVVSKFFALASFRLKFLLYISGNKIG
jgi:hypothetical protein